MKTFILLLLIIMNISNINAEDEILLGKTTKSQWLHKVGDETYNYLVDSTTCKKITNLTDENYKVIIFAGSWCHDSEVEVPKMIKVIETLELDYKIFAVDRDKLEPSGESIIYNIEKVPTLILIKNDEEIGRIVEYPVETIEIDLLNMLE